jgi:ketosteroid isomerase-like protein
VPAAPRAEREREVLAFERAWNQPLTPATLADIAPLLAEDYVHVDPGGRVERKADVLAGLGAFLTTIAPGSHRLVVDSLRVQLVGAGLDAAVVTYRVTASSVPRDGGEAARRTFHARAADVLERRGGRWLAVYTQETSVP